MSKSDNLTDFLTDIADAIRTKKGTTDKINPQDFSTEIENLESGSSIKQIIDETGTAEYLFYRLKITDASKYISYDDTQNVTNMGNMFNVCNALTTVPLFDTSQVTNMSDMFAGCTALTEVPLFDTRNVTTMNAMFNGCRALTEIWIKNIKVNLQVGSGTSYGHLLTVDSLVHLCNQLINVGSSRNLTIGSANLTKLASVYVKTIDITDEMRAEDDLIDSKLPCIVCESTDEGAMLISAYVQLKSWTLA